MTIGIDQYRMRVGLFKPNRKQSKCYLNLCEILCIGLIIYTKNKKHALLSVVLTSCLTEFKVENNIIASTCKVDDFPKQIQMYFLISLKGNFAIFYMLAKYVPGDIKYIFTKFYRHISTHSEANRKFVILISNFSTRL